MELRGATATVQALRRHVLFGVAVLVSLALFRAPLTDLLGLSFRDGSYSHVPFMPVLAGCFFYWKRSSIFSDLRYSFLPGALCMGLGLLSGFGLSHWVELTQSGRLSLSMCSVLLVWIGAFIACYGSLTFRKALFPFLLLLFVIPLPHSVSDTVVTLLRRSSVEAVYPVLRVVGLPVTKEGYVLHFPGMSIMISEECSGFHSLLALSIVSLIGARLFLSKGWSRTLAVVAIIPITIVKNGVRIIVISLIVVYLGENAFLSVFHKLVGFSLLALLLFWPVVVLLRRIEARQR